MKIVVAYLIRAALTVVPVAACWALARALGPWAALAAWAAIAAVASAAGAALVRSAPIGKVTWMNRVAGFLMPWGLRLGGGRLFPIALASWAVWVLLGAAGLLLTTRGVDAAHAGVAWNVLAALLFVAWVVDGGAAIYVLGSMVTNYSPRAAVSGPLVKIVGAAVALIGASVALYLAGHPGWALLVAGGPPLVLGSAFGLFFGVMMTAGKNARWN